MTMTISREAMDALRTLACSFGVPFNFFRCKLMAELDRCTVVEPGAVVAFRELDADGKPVADWRIGPEPILHVEGHSYELAYSAPPTASAEAQSIPQHVLSLLRIVAGKDEGADITVAFGPHDARIILSALTASTPALREVTDEDVALAIACELARIDGYDPGDVHGGLYDLRWSGGPNPEPEGDAWNMDYMPKAERIATVLRARLSTAQGSPAQFEHECPEWDGMRINPGMPEWDSCGCFVASGTAPESAK